MLKKVLYTYVVIILLQQICSNGSVDLIIEQRKEIEKLRAEITDAFENYEEKSISEKGVIVQPGWTESIKPHFKAISNVQVTNTSLVEVEILRSEINKAIEQDTYAAGIARTSAGNTKHVKILDLKFNSPDSNKSSASKHNVENENFVNSKNTEKDGLVQINNGNANTMPNVVNSNAYLEPDIDIRKLQHLQISKRRTREVLILKFIEEDLNFFLGSDVEEWAYILNSEKEYFIGRRITDLLIIRRDSPTHQSREILYVNQPISYLKTFLFWNLEQQKQDGIFIVATENKILWYLINNDTGKIELHWEWTISSIINGLTYFSTESNHYLAISFNESYRLESYTLNIYQFELQDKEFWIVQRIQLQVPCRDVSILDTGRDIILAVAQNSSAIIYMFNPHKNGNKQIRFQMRHSIVSENVDVVILFQMGGRYYVAIGGEQPKILLYQSGTFIPKTVLGSNFGLVENFLPIPARTYRDDLILLVQHRVDFGSHDIVILETLIWDGEAFETTIPIPCHIGDNIIYGINCMLDTQRDAGLKGAVPFKRGSEISVIVPRHNAESGIFHLYFDLLLKNSELLDLQDIFNFLKDWVKEQEDHMGKVQEFLKLPVQQILKHAEETAYIDHLTTSELYFNGIVNEIYVSNYKWRDDDTATNLDIIINTIEELENIISGGRKKREAHLSSDYYGILNVENLESETLFVKTTKNDEFYVQKGFLKVNGVLRLNSTEVLKNVIIRQNRKILENFFSVEGSIVFTEINNILWNNIKKKLFFYTDYVKIQFVEVEENIILEDGFAVEMLNSINFPNEYLWSSGPTTCVIRGKIVFTQTLIADAIDSDGVINGMDVFDAITITDPQFWRGFPTFTLLEVPEKLKLVGSACGHGLELFHKNPSLMYDKIIVASCNFEHLKVNVQPSYSAADEIQMAYTKIFSNIEFPINFQINFNTISEIPVSQFITMNTAQSINLSVLEHYVYFEEVKLAGLYNEIDIKRLFNNRVKVNSQQNIPEMQFNLAHSLIVQNINISSSLNDVFVERYQTFKKNFHVDIVFLTVLQTDILNFQRHIYGNAILNGIELQDFLNHNKTINLSNMFLNELILNGTVNTDQLHRIHEYYFFNFLNRIHELPGMILNGKIQVEHFIATGDIQLSRLNGRKFDEEFQLTVIWLNRSNHLGSYLYFFEPIPIQIDLSILERFNTYNFFNLLNDIIFCASDRTTIILPHESFQYNVYVYDNSKLDAIKGLQVQLIITKESVKKFYGTLDIHGNLFTQSFKTKKIMNIYPILDMSKLIHYNKEWKYFELVGDTAFYQQINLNDFNVSEYFGGLNRLYGFFKEFLLKNNIYDLKGKNTFIGKVTINDGIFIDTFNEYNLENTLNNIAFIHDLSTVLLKCNVAFHASVSVRSVAVSHDLNTTILRDCSLKEWLLEILLVDRFQNINRLTFKAGVLDNNSFNVHFLNNTNLSNMIYIYLEQYLAIPVYLSTIQLRHRVITKGLVNNLNLLKERNVIIFVI
ncbi:uncharacterized protein LOC119668745 isoform X2 [Teleopsis dalmanni]|uniref:uncharacterized protein LOC119668745 isoform X2 n=1 Tax=Teleopsis dalmanni TaxID=139649 RepID=UPI0018CCF4B3|nr:uncharacterized protein LOC119668745 isoform X2 [Teleopsis dalmanni]